MKNLEVKKQKLKEAYEEALRDAFKAALTNSRTSEEAAIIAKRSMNELDEKLSAICEMLRND